jgi:hypothetical protein
MIGDLVWEFIISAYITLTDEGGESQDFQAQHVYKETFTTNESLANIARSSGVFDFMLGHRRHADHQRVLVSDPVSRPMQRFTLAAAPVSQDRVKVSSKVRPEAQVLVLTQDSARSPNFKMTESGGYHGSTLRNLRLGAKSSRPRSL